jgi:hypothetical protein
VNACKRLLAVAFAGAVLLATVPAPQAIAAYQNQPAVEAPAEEAAPEDQPWTNRFLAPTALAITGLVIVAAGAHYVVRIRGRYRVMP